MSDLRCPVLLRLFLTLFIYLVSQANVAFGNAAGIVSHQRKPDLVISNIDIRMMAGFVGEIGDVVHEFHSLREVSEQDGSN